MRPRGKAVVWAGLCCLGLRSARCRLARRAAGKFTAGVRRPGSDGCAETPPAGPAEHAAFGRSFAGLVDVAIFVAISFALVALAVMNVLALRRESIVPAHLAAGVAAHLDDQAFRRGL